MMSSWMSEWSNCASMYELMLRSGRVVDMNGVPADSLQADGDESVLSEEIFTHLL